MHHVFACLTSFQNFFNNPPNTCDSFINWVAKIPLTSNCLSINTLLQQAWKRQLWKTFMGLWGQHFLLIPQCPLLSQRQKSCVRLHLFKQMPPFFFISKVLLITRVNSLPNNKMSNSSKTNANSQGVTSMINLSRDRRFLTDHSV